MIVEDGEGEEADLSTFMNRIIIRVYRSTHMPLKYIIYNNQIHVLIKLHKMTKCKFNMSACESIIYKVTISSTTIRDTEFHPV